MILHSNPSPVEPQRALFSKYKKLKKNAKKKKNKQNFKRYIQNVGYSLSPRALAAMWLCLSEKACSNAILLFRCFW